MHVSEGVDSLVGTLELDVECATKSTESPPPNHNTVDNLDCSDLKLRSNEETSENEEKSNTFTFVKIRREIEKNVNEDECEEDVKNTDIFSPQSLKRKPKITEDYLLNSEEKCVGSEYTDPTSNLDNPSQLQMQPVVLLRRLELPYCVNKPNMVIYQTKIKEVHLPEEESTSRGVDITSSKEPPPSSNYVSRQENQTPVNTNESTFTCTVCSLTFHDKVEYGKHIYYEQTKRRPYKCSNCSSKFCTPEELQNHKCKVVPKNLTCPICNKLYQSKKSLKYHLAKHFDKAIYPCNICNKPLLSKGALKGHMTYCHSELRLYECRVCKKAFKNQHQLASHEFAHTGIKPFECNKCGHLFGTKSVLIQHHSNMHSDLKPFVCKERYCSKAYAWVGQLNSHIKRCHGQKIHECKTCGKAFSLKRELNNHEKWHLGIKSFKCRFCHKCFVTPSCLKTHERTHTGVKPYSCDVCSRSFYRTGNLKKHKDIHQKIRNKPFACAVCSRTFSRKEYLMIHSRLHSTDKPYKCEKCGQTFVVSTNLKTHLKRHSSERRFSCCKCGKPFFTNKDKQIHEKMVDCSLKPFICATCNHSFATKRRLELHVELH